MVFISLVFSHLGLIVLTITIPFFFLKSIVLAEPGSRIVLVQLGCDFLPGISITFLKDANGPFAHVVHLGELIVAALVRPVNEASAKLVALQLNNSDAHSFLR